MLTMMKMALMQRRQLVPNEASGAAAEGAPESTAGAQESQKWAPLQWLEWVPQLAGEIGVLRSDLRALEAC